MFRLYFFNFVSHLVGFREEDTSDHYRASNGLADNQTPPGILVIISLHFSIEHHGRSLQLLVLDRLNR